MTGIDIPPVRCSILGNAGGGKSVLARAAASKLGVPVHELDNHLWKGRWQSASEAEFTDIHDAIISADQWIVDGFGLVDSVYPRIARSTHIIYVDLPIWLHFALAAERQGTWRAGTLKRPPGGLPSPPPTKDLFELMWRIHTELAPSVKAAVDAAATTHCRVQYVETLEQLRSLQFDPVSFFR